MLSLLMGMAMYAKGTQNNKYAISLQYLKNELSYEVNVLHNGRHESFLLVDTIIFDGVGQTPKVIAQVCNVFVTS